MNEKDARISELEEALRPFVEHFRSIKGTFAEDAGWKFSERIYCNPVRKLYKRDFLRAKTALSITPTDKALVDVEKLRELEWCGHLCPVCDGVDPNWSMAIYVEADKKGHTPECWLGNALKVADDVA